MTTTSNGARLSVRKTFKLYIGGAFPRTESGRYMTETTPDGTFVAHLCRASRKDLRNAVVVARKAQGGWAKRTGFNRAQILYRMAEMLEGQRARFVDALVTRAAYDADEAAAEVDAAIDRLVWYAGWGDKFAQAFGSINPVAGPYFDFSMPEPTGVVSVFAPENAPLLGLISTITPVIISGNTCVVVASGVASSIAIDLAEVLALSDLPGGVVNLLTGQRDELVPHAATHQDIDALLIAGPTDEHHRLVETEAATTMKRVKVVDDLDRAAWRDDAAQSPMRILPFVEFKTAWHPMGM